VNAGVSIQVLEKEVTLLNRSATVSFLMRTVLYTVNSTSTLRNVWDDYFCF
jgi:hypothetical protein